MSPNKRQKNKTEFNNLTLSILIAYKKKMSFLTSFFYMFLVILFIRFAHFLICGIISIDYKRREKWQRNLIKENLWESLATLFQ